MIIINDKSMDVNTFHKTIASLGFITVGRFHMHRLLQNEIKLLGMYTGDDLWNLVLKVNECDDLLEVNEVKHVSRNI